MVFGPRQYRRSRLGGWTVSNPEPFQSIAIWYENSYGGHGFKANPVGRGCDRATLGATGYEPQAGLDEKGLFLHHGDLNIQAGKMTVDGDVETQNGKL